MSRPWEIRREAGDVGAFHAGSIAGSARRATFVRTEKPTWVLGSSQPASRVDVSEAGRRGIEVVGRRSGGGGVLLVPDEFVWLDLWIGVDDPLWRADVAWAMVWVGDLWTAALSSLGIDGRVHDGAMESSRWSGDVCWAGRGTGEVLDATGSKLVGVSQRRTRDGARFQSMAHLVWRPDVVASLVSAPRPTIADLATVAAVVPGTCLALEAALLAALP